MRRHRQERGEETGGDERRPEGRREQRRSEARAQPVTRGPRLTRRRVLAARDNRGTRTACQGKERYDCEVDKEVR